MSEHEYPRTDWSTTSFSELATLAACEQKWYRRYVLGEPTESGPAANTGTFFHTGTAKLYETGNDLEAALDAIDEDVDLAYPDGPTSEQEIASVLDANWLVARYSRHYAMQIRQATVVANEIKLERSLHFPTRDGWKEVTVKGSGDSLLSFGPNLWLREAKTSKRRDVLETADVAPQITLYWWMLEDFDPKPYGVMFDYAYTYHWKATKPTQAALIEDAPPNILAMTKKDQREWAKNQVMIHPGVERPDSESFEVKWLDRNEAQVEAGVEWAQDILERRDYLTTFVPGVDRTPAMRNIGPSCKFCDHKASCYAGLAFPQDDIALDLS